MYKLDSGLISIIATIAAIIIGVYSSMNDKKKVQARRKMQEHDLSADETDAPDTLHTDASERAESSVKMFNNPFEELFKPFKEEEQSREPKSNGQFVYAGESEEDDLFSFSQKEPEISGRQVEPDPVQEKKITPMQGFGGQRVNGMEFVEEYSYDNGMESIENSGISLMKGQPVNSNEMTDLVKEPVELSVGDSLKKRIKQNPKDLVLFAEILRPKYQEF